MDVPRYVRFLRPGYRVTGDRSRTSAEVDRRVGHDCVHAIVDDHSRIAFAEILPDQKAATATDFLERALAFFAEQASRRSA